MIPLVWVFLIWIVLVGIFCLVSLVTLTTTLRYGLSCSWTYLTAGLFIAVSVTVVLLTLGYAASIDLHQGFDVFSLL